MLRTLTAEQKERLTRILDRYLSELERGVPQDAGSLVNEHPDLAEPLKLYLDSLNDLQGISAGFSQVLSCDLKTEQDDPGSKRLGAFILGRQVGRGGMGVVYEARQISLGRRVAIKVLPFAAVLDTKQIARFKNEAQAAAQLHHPHIVPVFAVGADRGVHYYAMQFIEGHPLDQAIEELRRQAGIEAEQEVALDAGELVVDRAIEGLCPSTGNSLFTAASTNRREFLDTAVRLGIDVARALHAAHEYGVVHRDVKPSNLLLDDQEKIWITDFGLARCQNDITLTKTGDVVGTMGYMSPEQALGQTSLVDHRTDVYSLAATLYELLTLQPAVVAVDEPALLHSRGQREPRSLRKIDPSIPGDLDTVVMKALAGERDERYSTAGEFADDLQRVLECRPTVARPPTVAERVSKWALRHRQVVAIAGGVCVAAMIGLTVMTLLIAREKYKAQQNAQFARRRLDDAHNAVDRFGAQLAEKLGQLSGTEELRHEVLRDTLQYYEDFVAEAGNDPNLQDDLALTYSKIGVLTDQIGSCKQAIEAHEKAVTGFAALAAAAPTDSEYRRRLGLCHNNMALTLRRAGRVTEARRSYLAAIELQMELVDEGAGTKVVGDLALSHTNLGLLHSELGELELAATSLRAAIRLQEGLLADSVDQPEVLAKLAATYNNLSAVYLRSGLVKATECYAISLRHQKRAVEAQPNNLTLQSSWALTYNNLGALQSRSELYAEAATSYGQAIQIQQRLVAAAPAQKSYRRDLAISLNNRGRMQSRLGTPVQAERSFKQSLELHSELVIQYPNDIDLQSSLGGVYNNLGVALEELHRLEDAGRAYKRAVEHQRIAFDQAKAVSRYRLFLSKHYYNYGRVLRQLGYPEQAARSAIARRELWPHDPRRLFAIAEELALAGYELRTLRGVEITADRCAELAIETLDQAFAAGLPRPLDLSDHEAFTWMKDHRGWNADQRDS